MMGLYLSAIIGDDPNTSDAVVRNDLAKTYGTASEISVNICGKGYVQTTTAVGSGASGGVRTTVGALSNLSIMLGVFAFALFL
jgi:hypothetical protein